MKHYRQMTRQAGMTLIELTVVLLVLVGLAGLLIPFVTGFVGRTHDSTGTFNSAALDNNIQRYVAEKTSLPNRLEALVNVAAGSASATDPVCAAAAIDTVYCKMMEPNFFATAVADTGTPGPTTMRANSLAMAGITNVFYNDPDTDNATFASITGNPVTLNDGAAHTLAIVADVDQDGTVTPGAVDTQEHLAAAFERPIDTFDATCYDYVVMGIGDQSDLIGSTMSTAPVHFAQQGAMGPANKYNRFVAIFQVDKTNAAVAPVAGTNAGCAAGMEPAKFIGAAMAMGASAGHLWGTSHSLAHTWENIAAN